MRQLAAVLSFATFLVAQRGDAPTTALGGASGQGASSNSGRTARDPAMETEPELGTVAWQRNFAAALAQARDGKLPVFLLFQEIPGCATCTNFGANVLSHPLLVPAIEQCFVPVVVRNNVDGEEGAIRQRFAEPAWNNPVVRFLDGDGKDVLPRADGVFDVHPIAARMIQALEGLRRPVPGYLRIAHAESDPKTEHAVFTMHCFWEGEAELGNLEGVVRTRSGFVDGAEVVAVTFRPDVLPLAKLYELAQAKNCRPITGGTVGTAPASDQQHALGGTAYAKLTLTPMQRMKVHTAITQGKAPDDWLTPSQRAAARPPSAPTKK